MNQVLKFDRSPMTPLRDACPQFAEACRDYERATSREDEKAIAGAFSRMQEIASIFWSGVEFGQQHRPLGDSIRAWRAGEG